MPRFASGRARSSTTCGRGAPPPCASSTTGSGAGWATAGCVLGADELTTARDALEPHVRRALEQAIEHVRRFAETQRPATTTTTIIPGVEIERRWTPISSVGCYVPAAQAPLPSSLVMTVVPARVAGVERIVVASPAGPAGVDPIVLGAAGLLGVDQVLVAGGAQAVAALAFGLPDAGFERVDRIVGPGSVWVTAAKLELAGDVGIDLPAGPSEGLVLADASADPELVAADLLTQAEHGPDSPAVLVTTSATLADQVEQRHRKPCCARTSPGHPRTFARTPRRHRARTGSRTGDRLRERLRP